ncbi:MAG: hypothetical protein OXC31_06910 [Spirochaetaceae bacterium]|nr:hypothetical protein [Spirochaetaceae bacterium]
MTVMKHCSRGSKVAAMIATTVIVAATAALVGCEEPLMPDDPPVGDAPGMKADPPDPPKQDEPPDPPKQDEPADETGFGIDETYNDLHEGARLTMRYDRATRAFRGRVENTTTGFRMTVRVEVVSGGTTLRQTDSIDLMPETAQDVLLQVAVADDARWEPRLVFVAREAVSNSPGTPTPQQPTPQPPAVPQGPIDCDAVRSEADVKRGPCPDQWYLQNAHKSAKDPYEKLNPNVATFHPDPTVITLGDADFNCPCWYTRSGTHTGADGTKYTTHFWRQWMMRKDLVTTMCPATRTGDECPLGAEQATKLTSGRTIYKLMTVVP